MNKVFKIASQSGVALLAIATILNAGCEHLSKAPPVIAVPDSTVPHKIEKGESAPISGWILPTPLFNELMPCFRSVLENADPVDDGWRPNVLPPNAPKDMP